MVAAVARGHGGDGAGDPPPSPRQLESGHRGSQPRRGRGRGRGRGGRDGGGGRGGGRKAVRQGTKNVDLKKAVKDYGPVRIDFDYVDQQNFAHVGKNAKWFSNYVGELIREFPLYYPSWHKIEKEKKAHVMQRLGEHFNLERHRNGPQWKTIKVAIDTYLARRYGNNKHDRKRDYFTSQGGVDNVDEIRRRPPPNVDPSEWEKHIQFYLEEGNQLRAKTNAENRKKNKVSSRHGSRSLAVSRHEYFENSETHEFPSLIQSFYDSRCKNGEWLQDEARVQYEVVIRKAGAARVRVARAGVVIRRMVAILMTRGIRSRYMG